VEKTEKQPALYLKGADVVSSLMSVSEYAREKDVFGEESGGGYW